jgi:hypothetical protein
MKLLEPIEAPLGIRGVYEASTDHGDLRLELETVSAAAPACAAEAALRLALAEPLLQALEEWLEALPGSAGPPDWQWQGAPGQGPAGGAVARWAGPGVGASLGLPWSLLRRLPPPPDALARELLWLPVEAELVLATLTLPPEEEAALEPGGALLLPASFEPDWIACLRAADERTGGLLVVVDPAGTAVRQCIGAQEPGVASAADLPEPDCLSLRCALPQALAPELLLGWRDEAIAVDLGRPVDLACPPPGATLAGPAPEIRRAQGRLMPWGEGRALWIEAVGGSSAA